MSSQGLLRIQHEGGGWQLAHCLDTDPRRCHLWNFIIKYNMDRGKLSQYDVKKSAVS